MFTFCVFSINIFAASRTIGSINKITIEDFVDFDEYGYGAYKTIYIFESERADTVNLLPTTIDIVTPDGETVAMPVKWNCYDDIETTSYNMYAYEVVLPDGYELSEKLQNDYNRYRASLPFVYVEVVPDGVYQEVPSEFPFSEIRNKWKDMDDDELNEYIANNSDSQIYKFLNSLSGSELELLLSKDTMLLNETKVTDESNPDGYKSMRYYEYILGGMSETGKQARVGNYTPVTGYSYYVFEDEYYGFSKKYKVTYKITDGGDSVETKTYWKVSAQTVVSSSGDFNGFTGFDNITFSNGAANGDMKRTADTNANYTTGVTDTREDGTVIYQTKPYNAFYLTVDGVYKPAYAYTGSKQENTSYEVRYNWRKYNWQNNGTNTRNDNIYNYSHADDLNVQVHMLNTGITHTESLYQNPSHATLYYICKYPKLKVYFNGNGGSITSDKYYLKDNVVYVNTDNDKATQTWVYNVPESNGLANNTTFGLSKKGYTFGGWGTSASGGTIFDQNDNSLTPYEILSFTNGEEWTSKSKTLYAQWNPITYTVKYNGNNNTGGSTASSNHTYDTAKNLTANGFTRTGYTFAGWNTKADGTGKSYTDKQSVKNLTSTNNGTINLYAIWKPNTYTVIYDGNGSTAGSTASSTHTYDTAKNLTANGFTKTGYTFKGWNTKADGTGTSYTDKASVKNLTTVNGGTVTLYAQWQPITYTVIYDGNGADGGSTAPSSHIYDKEGTLSFNGFTREIHKFIGWNTKADGSGTTYVEGETVKNLTSEDNATITLYAIWKIDEMNLEAKIESVHYPYDNNFKNGEMGVLTIYLEGFVDRVEVIFPEELTQYDDSLNRTYTLEPKEEDSITQNFFIPLYSEHGAYTVEVRAYNIYNQEKVVYPDFTVHGSILNKIRTRIREK